MGDMVYFVSLSTFTLYIKYTYIYNIGIYSQYKKSNTAFEKNPYLAKMVNKNLNIGKFLNMYSS